MQYKDGKTEQIRRNWTDVMKLLDSYLDVLTMLNLSISSRDMYNFKWKLNKQDCYLSDDTVILSFSFLRGYNADLIINAYKNILKRLSSNTLDKKIILDFSKCVLFKDLHIVDLMEEISIKNDDSSVSDINSDSIKLHGLNFDFCTNITDNGVLSMLSCSMPYLNELSLRCIRNESFSGEPFVSAFSRDLWSSIKKIRLDFSSIYFDVLWNIAEKLCLIENINENKTPDYLQDDLINHLCRLNPQIELTFIGTLASRQYFEAINCSDLVESLDHLVQNLKSEDVYHLFEEANHKFTKRFMALEKNKVFCNVCSQGGTYLINMPVSISDNEERGLNVWSLPINMSIKSGNVDVVKAFIECGAIYNILDYLNECPLNKAVKTGNREITQLLLSYSVELTPLNITLPSCINQAILIKDYVQLELLLQHRYPLRIKAPNVSSFKSPLHIASELADVRAIHMLLDWGADPNEYSGTHKNSAVMLAYKSNVKLMYIFLHSVKFDSMEIASELLAAAIAKNDFETTEVMVSLFPNLLLKKHPTWCLPLFHAARTGKNVILKYFINSIITILYPGCVARTRFFPVCNQHIYITNPNFSLNHIDLQSESFTDGIQIDSSKKHKQLKGEKNNKLIKIFNLGKKNTTSSYLKASTQFSIQNQSFVQLSESSEGYNQIENKEFIKFLNITEANTKYTALHYAVEGGYIECVKHLLRFGCDVNCFNNNNDTPLHIACQEDHYLIASYLLCCGADAFNLFNNKNENCLMVALKNRNDQVAKVIIQFYHLCKVHSVDLVCKNPKIISKNSFLAFQYIIKFHRFDVLKYYICFGPEVDFSEIPENSRRDSETEARQILESSSTSAGEVNVIKHFLYYSSKGIKNISKYVSLSQLEDNLFMEPIIIWKNLCLICSEDQISDKNDKFNDTFQDTFYPKSNKLQSIFKLISKKNLNLFGSKKKNFE